MDFTKEQLSEVLCKHAERENGLQDLMEIMIESMMVADDREYLRKDGQGRARTSQGCWATLERMSSRIPHLTYS